MQRTGRISVRIKAFYKTNETFKFVNFAYTPHTFPSHVGSEDINYSANN